MRQDIRTVDVAIEDGAVVDDAEIDRILSYGHEHLRDLPWRRTRDPWAILVSEVMLQQTQVARVLPHWEQFLDRWPTPAACAVASVGDLLEQWQGLGYPRRARDLRLAAVECVARHGGTVPSTLEELLVLPGIGPYTARAVLSFAYEVDVGVVDTNIARILARRAGRRLRPKEAQESADAWVPPGQSWEWNQVLMDLGSTRCRPAPDCHRCPVTCAWRDAGHPLPDPAVGSAGVSGRQARFAGSDRQLRGRVLSAVTAGGSDAEGIERRLVEEGIEAHRVASVVASLRADGLVIRDAEGLLVHP